MDFLPEVPCVSTQRTINRLGFGDDPDLTDLHETFVRGVSLAEDQSIKYH